MPRVQHARSISDLKHGKPDIKKYVGEVIIIFKMQMAHARQPSKCIQIIQTTVSHDRRYEHDIASAKVQATIL